MKTRYLSLLLAGTMFFVSCKQEGKLLPSERVMMSRYEFPQGNNPWDVMAEEIHEEFGIYLIYKDFTSEDFLRSWTGSGLTGVTTYGEVLTDEQAERHIRFMKNHIFAYLTRDILKKVSPTYYMLVYDMHVNFELFPGFGMKVPVESDYDGLDFWTHCIFYGDPCPITGETLETPETREEFDNCRFYVLQAIMRTSFQRGNIEIPAGFADNFDFETEIKNADAFKDDPDYVIARGFPPSFVTTGKGASNYNNIREVRNGALTQLFLNYLHAAMRYTDQQYEELWPQAKYPLIHQKRALVINHVKTTYNIELQAMAEGPAIFD